MVIADKISELIGTQKQISILDYGCATGLIGFELSDKYQKLILMDSEKEMLDVVKEKMEAFQVNNIIPILKDLTKENYNEEKFDVIYTSMALHHIVDTENMIQKFYDLLKENGILCVVELDKEDGSFRANEENFEGHNGFEHQVMQDLLKNVGFSEIKSETFFCGEKKAKEKVIPYSLFYTIGRK